MCVCSNSGATGSTVIHAAMSILTQVRTLEFGGRRRGELFGRGAERLPY